MDRATEVKVGALVLSAVALLVFLVLLIGDFRFDDGTDLYVDYVFVGSLQEGAPVRSSGLKVGKVEEIAFMGGEVNPATGELIQIRLKIWVEERAMNNVREDSRFSINTEGVLGEQYVEIIPGTAIAKRLSPRAIVRGEDPPRTDLMMQKAFQLFDGLNSLLHGDQFGKTFEAVGRLLTATDEILSKNRDQIGPLLENINILTEQLTRGLGETGEIKQILADTRIITSELRKNFPEMSADIRKVVADKKEAGENTVELTDPKKGPLVQSMNRVEASLNQADGAIEHFDASLTKIDDVVIKLEVLLGRVGAGPARWVLADEDQVQKPTPVSLIRPRAEAVTEATP